MKRISQIRERADTKRGRSTDGKSSKAKNGKPSDAAKLRFDADLERLRRIVDADD